MKKNYSKRGFSLVEVLMALIVISCIIAAFAPVMTRKMNTSINAKAGSSGDGYETKLFTVDSADCTFDATINQAVCQYDIPVGVDTFDAIIVSGGGGGAASNYTNAAETVELGQGNGEGARYDRFITVSGLKKITIEKLMGGGGGGGGAMTWKTDGTTGAAACRTLSGTITSCSTNKAIYMEAGYQSAFENKCDGEILASGYPVGDSHSLYNFCYSKIKNGTCYDAANTANALSLKSMPQFVDGEIVPTLLDSWGEDCKTTTDIPPAYYAISGAGGNSGASLTDITVSDSTLNEIKYIDIYVGAGGAGGAAKKLTGALGSNVSSTGSDGSKSYVYLKRDDGSIYWGWEASGGTGARGNSSANPVSGYYNPVCNKLNPSGLTTKLSCLGDGITSYTSVYQGANGAYKTSSTPTITSGSGRGGGNFFNGSANAGYSSNNISGNKYISNHSLSSMGGAGGAANWTSESCISADGTPADCSAKRNIYTEQAVMQNSGCPGGTTVAFCGNSNYDSHTMYCTCVSNTPIKQGTCDEARYTNNILGTTLDGGYFMYYDGAVPSFAGDSWGSNCNSGTGGATAAAQRGNDGARGYVKFTYEAFSAKGGPGGNSGTAQYFKNIPISGSSRTLNITVGGGGKGAIYDAVTPVDGDDGRKSSISIGSISLSSSGGQGGRKSGNVATVGGTCSNSTYRKDCLTSKMATAGDSSGNGGNGGAFDGNTVPTGGTSSRPDAKSVIGDFNVNNISVKGSSVVFGNAASGGGGGGFNTVTAGNGADGMPGYVYIIYKKTPQM